MNHNLEKFAQDFIKERYIAVVACVSENKPYSFTCWYRALNGKIYWKSRTQSIHSKAFKINNSASLCIYDHGATYPDNKTGVQLIGTVEMVTDEKEMIGVLNSFAEKFGPKVIEKNNIPELLSENTQSTFYSFTPKQFKLVSKEIGVHMEEYEGFSL